MKIRQNTNWMVILAILSAFTGCVYEKNEPSPLTKDNSLKISFTLPPSEVRTRAIPAEEGENTVNDLTLFFFEPTANGTGKFLGHYEVPQEDIPAEDEMLGVMNNMFDLEITLTSGHKLSASAAYSILAAANMNKNYFENIETGLSGFITDIEQMTLQEVMVHTMMRVQGAGIDESNDNYPMSKSNLPMSAVCQKQEKVAHVECNLKRAVVRYDVVNKASGYRLVSASIWNAFPIGSLFDGVDINYSIAPLKRYYGMKNSDGFDEIHGGLYSFENVSPSPDPKDEKTTCLIFGMSPEIDLDKVYYYRVNISPKVTGQYLMRNNVYQVTISAVNKTGAGSEIDAYTDGEMNLDTSINSWDRDEDGLIIRDGDNMMALPTKRAVFGPQAEERQYFVYTLGEGTLEMSYLSMPSGMNAWLGGKGNDLYISVTSYGADERKGAIELRFAGMKGVIEIIQNGTEKKMLQLSYTNLATWPAGTDKVNAIKGKPIIVESSGPWTAEIYNGNFSFDNINNSDLILRGNNGDGIHSIFNTSINPNPENRHSFILVSLDDDPEKYQSAVVLTQLGVGGFTLNPNTTHVNFNADGSLTAGSDNFNEFEVFPGNPADTWIVSITDMQGNPTSDFAFEYISGTPVNNQVQGQGSFRVTSPGDNYDEEKEGILTITHNGTNEKKIYLFKDSYDLSLSHYNLSLTAKGGNTTTITVSSNMTGAKWSATISSNLPASKGLIPYLVDENNNRVSTLTSLDAGKTFKVYMPGINQHLTNQERPEATVTVSLDGSALTTALVVTQEMVAYDKIYAQTINSMGLGNWCYDNKHDAAKVFGQWKTDMTDPSHFGPNGTVYIKEVINTTKASGSSVANQNDGVVKIINMNGDLPGNSWASYRTGRDDVVFIVSSWGDKHKAFTGILGLQPYTMEVYGDYSPIPNASTARVVYDADHIKRTEIWKYVCGGEGPFPIDYQEVKLYPQYWPKFQSTLVAWPETFIPLIMSPTADGNSTPNPNRVVVGVDPTNRVIWIGHKDLFGTDGSGAPANWYSYLTDNHNFLRNLIAWVVNVNNYGDAFNDRFKGDRSK